METFAKFTKIPWAVSGRREVHGPSSCTGPIEVRSMPLKSRGSVNSPRVPQLTHTTSARCPAVPFLLVLLEQLVGPVTLVALLAFGERIAERRYVPEASHTCGARITEESRPTTSSRPRTTFCHQGALDVLPWFTPQRTVVPGGPTAAVDLRGGVFETPALAEVDNRIDAVSGHLRGSKAVGLLSGVTRQD